jgi:peroxiredoxin
MTRFPRVGSTLFVCLVLVTLTSFDRAQLLGQETLAIGDAMPQFELNDFRGKTWSSDELSKDKVVAVVFYGVECPLVKLYSRRLSEFQNELGEEKVQFIGIDANRQDSLVEIGHFAKTTEVSFPLLKDPGNRIADAFGAQRTPEVFVFDRKGVLQYRGLIDDQYTYGRQKPKVENEYAMVAIRSVLEDKQPETKVTEPVGCLIGRQLQESSSDEVTYCKQISRIIQNRCVQCHREGEIAPFNLTEYDEVVGWAEMIREVVNENRMPPWHANPEYGEFSNDAGLTDEEKRLINTWVENGAPKGNDVNLPPVRKFVDGWQIGVPDFVIAMDDKPFKVPATGILEYEYFVVDPKFKEDKYVSAAEIRIGNRAVVHHVIVAGKSRRGRRRTEIGSEWITACAPGSPPLQLPDGFAKLIPAGSKLIFQMHYTPNGTAGEDRTQVGFKFVDRAKVKRIVGTHEVANERFRIPAHADHHEVKAKITVPKNVLLLTMFPHMHLRGKAFRFTADFPDGNSEILLDVPNYDFNWQNGYHLKKPRLIPKGTVLTCIAHFDNSKKNIANPDPTKTVRWGDQTFEEMMIGYFDFARADETLQQE